MKQTMNLKPQVAKVSIPLPVSPVWGDVADSGQPVTAVVFECTEAAYSYPYHTLSRWVLTPGTSETLRVQAGEDEVTIQGRNLKSISDALASARLRTLRAICTRYDTPNDEVVVSRISVETQLPPGHSI
jgi:hypothetical protein